ncbi:MAG: HEPN domain-containing protein [archaeon]
MDSEVNLYLLRAEDEFLLSQKDLQVSTDDKTKDFLGIPKDKTFYYSVISHAYYSIFYAAKAYLLTKGIKTKVPNEHKKTFKEFEKLVKEGVLDKELLKIYEAEIIKADFLLKIFQSEKKKRGTFTYQIKSEANLPFAEESIDNARKFISNIKAIVS